MATTAPARLPVGALTERLTLLSDAPRPVPLVTLEQTSGRAVGTTATPHGLQTGDYVTVSGASPAAYNGTRQQVLVLSPTSFSYGVPDTTASPATGTITVLFESDAQGGQGDGLWIVGDVWAQVEALSGSERLEAEAIGSVVDYRVTLPYQPDLSPRMKIQWRKFREATARTLEIHAVTQHADYPHDFSVLDCGELT